jgi:hypothetical protein
MLHSGQQYVNDLDVGMHAKLLCMQRENQVLLQGICKSRMHGFLYNLR